MLVLAILMFLATSPALAESVSSPAQPSIQQLEQARSQLLEQLNQVDEALVERMRAEQHLLSQYWAAWVAGENKQ